MNLSYELEIALIQLQEIIQQSQKLQQVYTMLNITLMHQERIIRRKADSVTSTLFTIPLVLVLLLIPAVKTQTNFNYAGNGDYKDHGCTTAQLSSIYGCLKPTSNFGYRMWFMYNSASYYNFENEANFNTTMTGFVAVTMDYQSGSSYYKRQYYHDIHPIYGGNYKLSFSAMTRKTGTLSDFAFMVIIRDQYSKNVIYFNKTYTFLDYGTINVTESITLPGINYRGWAYVHFMYTGSNTTAYNYPVGTGITNVKFQKLVCGANQTSILLATGETACILNKTIEGFNYCNRFNYYHKNESGYGYIYKRFVCEGCISPYKTVGFRDDTVTQYDKYFTNHKYGCVINQIPNAVWYSLLNIQDGNGKYYYTTQSCNGGSINYLVVPGISSSNYDYSRGACGISSNASVTWWQVVNSTYYPAKCSSAGYFPVITSATTRVCQSISSQITNCVIYLQNYKCYSCMSNTTLITWNNSGTLTDLCVANFQPVSNCLTYTSVSGAYVCGTCDANYTLSTVYSLNLCIRNIALDGNCSTYVRNANNQYECSVCAAGYTLLSVYTVNQEIKKCLSTTTQIIRDCAVYKSIPEGYQCQTCTNTTNIAKYSFIYNSVSAYKCLNLLTEYLAYCSTYDLVSSVYKCVTCATGYLLSNLTVNSVLSLKCLNILTEVISNCNGYLTDVSNNYVCSSCSTGFTLKPISQVSKCLPNIVIDSQCTTYILNGSNYECSQCASEYTLSRVLTNIDTLKYCLLMSAQIRDCSVYSPATSGYQCSQCLTNLPNIHIYSISVNGLSIDRCLDNQIEYDRYCQTYSFSNNVYKCTECLNSLRFGSVTINPGVYDRCLDDYKHYVANCAAYVMSGQEDYVCSQCDAGYGLQNAQVSDAANNYMFTYKRCFNKTEKVANCVSYITYSIVTTSLPKFICKQCESGFTMKNVSQVPRCLANNLIDSQCTSYVSDSNTFRCNQCASSYTVSSVYKTDGTFSNCLLTSSRIRDCAIYEALQSEGYQCKQCAQSTNIDRQIFTVSGVQIYRCLNRVSEKIELCTAYKFESQVYECIQCENNHLFKSVSIENVERKRCLDLNSQVVEDCLHYVYDFVNTKYVCDQCSDQFTLKPDNFCVHDDSLQDDCIQYRDNGLKEECTKCANGYGLSSVTITNVDVAQCLSSDQEIIVGCKKYELISSIYNCLECDLTYSKQTVVFSTKNVSMCLVSSSQCVSDCLTYSIDQDEDFVCNSCQNGFDIKDGTVTKKLCIANANLETNCIKYKDNGASEECTQCDSSFTLSNVEVSGTLTKECLSNSSDIVTQCKIYQKASGTYKCRQCNPNYSKQTVTVNSLSNLRCLQIATEVVEDCLSYILSNQGKYLCNQCSLGHTLAAGVGAKLCINDNNLQDDCIEYKDDGTSEQCILCSQLFTLSIVISGSQRVKKCLLTASDVIKYCKVYELLQNGALQCSECHIGSTQSNVVINFETHVRCLLNSIEIVDDCQTYTISSSGKFICSQCDDGFTLENAKKDKICVSSDNLEDNCIRYKDNGVFEQCIQCDQLFSLLTVFFNGNLKNKCLLSTTNLLTGCNIYEYLPSGDIQCKQCDFSHSLELIRLSDTKSSKKCINNEDKVLECLSYVSVGLSCAYDCFSCSSGFKLATVKVGHRITKGCLSQSTEYLPFCNFHFNQHGVYYCRHAICQAGSFGIRIGPDPTELACANNELIEFVNETNCEYFERPHYGDTEIKCDKCKDGFEEPYCSASDYQGLNGGQ